VSREPASVAGSLPVQLCFIGAGRFACGDAGRFAYGQTMRKHSEISMRAYEIIAGGGAQAVIRL
jgi:hypothetical protein